ncbi:hypothetical protein ZWY2020_044780 [Hordeum vulgare]|nr:hypothetical protein ZWY2020_044780 [Hordeum vulgare]
MDPHIRNLEEEELLEDIIKDGPDVEPAESPSSYLNQDVGMEIERHEDEVDGAGDRSNDGEGDSSTDGEAGEEIIKSGEGGRTRGFGPSYPWWLGFARDQDTYRSRERAKKRQQDEENDKFNQLLARINEQQKQIDELRGVLRQEDLALDITDAPSKRKSSVAESEAPPDDERRMIEGGPGYPVDGIKESTSCELHQKFKNISMKVAVGQALPSGPDARCHGREIPAGFAKVGVDEIMTGFNDMELDIARPGDERTLIEVLGGVILWDKNYIKLPGSAPRTTPPPSRRRSPTPPLPPSPPHDVG